MLSGLGGKSPRSRGTWSRRTREAQGRSREGASAGSVERRGGASGHATAKPSLHRGCALEIRPLGTDGMSADHGRPPRGLGRWRATEMGGGRRGQSRDAERSAGQHGETEEPRLLDRGRAPDQQLTRPFAQRRGDASVGAPGASTPVSDEHLMERGGERHNRLTARARVKAKGGSAGLDGMPVEDLPAS
jgi:hypothetical protein